MSLPAARGQKAESVIPHQKFEGHTGWVTNVIHLRGGQRIMTSSLDHSLRVWNVESGTQIGEDWRDEGARLNTIALSPDGKRVVSGSGDGAVRLWDIDTAEVIATWTGHTASVNSLCWNGDGRRVVSCAYDDGTVRVWDVETGETKLGPLKFGNVEAVVYSPDETMVAAGGGPNEIGFIKIFDANTGKLVKNLEQEPSGTVICLAWPPHVEGHTLISGSFDDEIRIWDTTTWQQIAVLAHTGAVCHIAISPNGRILASASLDGTARLWNLENSQPIGSPIQHAMTVHRLSFSADGKILATACWDKNAYTWDVSVIIRGAGLEKLLSSPHVGFAFPF
jgi:WD40 repeat protein